MVLINHRHAIDTLPLKVYIDGQLHCSCITVYRCDIFNLEVQMNIDRSRHEMYYMIIVATVFNNIFINFIIVVLVKFQYNLVKLHLQNKNLPKVIEPYISYQYMPYTDFCFKIKMSSERLQLKFVSKITVYLIITNIVNIL